MKQLYLKKFEHQIASLETANRQLETQARSLAPRRVDSQPAHVLYGGAHLFSEKTFGKVNKLAMESFQYAIPDSKSLQALIDSDGSPAFVEDIYRRISSKMRTRALEDYRIDFEDGYGSRPDDEEDQHAINAAIVIAGLAKSEEIACALGIRVKPLSTSSMRRSLRTLVIFIETLAESLNDQRQLKHIIITLPKVTCAEHVSTLVNILEDYETTFPDTFKQGFFKIELLIEAPEAFLAHDGSIPIASFAQAARGRCHSLHFGVFDFTSSLGIGSAGQAIDHLACDFARMWMQIIAGIAPGLAVSDGIINQLPMIPKSDAPEAKRHFEKTWKYNFEQMRRSLTHGFYQGWDLHPCQLHIRHLAHIVFVMRECEGAAARMRAFVAKSSQASHVKGLFDDRASVLGILNFFERAVHSGILTLEELLRMGIDLKDIRASI